MEYWHGPTLCEESRTTELGNNRSHNKVIFRFIYYYFVAIVVWTRFTKDESLFHNESRDEDITSARPSQRRTDRSNQCLYVDFHAILVRGVARDVAASNMAILAS